jgi:ABC transporter DrrB family efflux protein
MAFGGFVTALGLADDLGKGLIDRFRSLPMSRAAVLAGRTSADVVTNMVSLLVMVGVGILVGFGFSQPFYDVLLGFVLMLGFGYAFSWVFAWVGLAASSPESAQAIGFVAIFPLTFASSAFVPTSSMPAAIEAFANANPFSTIVNALRHLWVGGPAGDDVWLACIEVAALILFFSFLSVNRYRRAVSR